MATPDATKQVEGLVTALLALQTSYKETLATLEEELDRDHHAYRMRESGKAEVLSSAINSLEELIVEYDKTTFTLTFNINNCDGLCPDPQEHVAGSFATLPTKGNLGPDAAGLAPYGWSLAASGNDIVYPFGAEYKMPRQATTLYLVKAKPSTSVTEPSEEPTPEEPTPEEPTPEEPTPEELTPQEEGS